jgi:transcriptional regulator with XRE-family HTH domain
LTLTLGDRLKSIRVELGHTQKTMSDALGLGIRTWQTYELGNSLPKAETLNQLSELGYSIDWLLTGLGPMRIGGTAEDSAAYDHQSIDGELMGRVTEAILKLYRDENVKLPPVDQGRLAALIYCEVELVSSPAGRLGALQYLIESKRRELRSAPAGGVSSKRQA